MELNVEVVVGGVSVGSDACDGDVVSSAALEVIDEVDDVLDEFTWLDLSNEAVLCGRASPVTAISLNIHIKLSGVEKYPLMKRLWSAMRALME